MSSNDSTQSDAAVDELNVTDVLDLDTPEEVVLEALREDFGDDVDQDLQMVAKQAVESRIYELRANRESVEMPE
jgi:hypothetical protein